MVVKHPADLLAVFDDGREHDDLADCARLRFTRPRQQPICRPRDRETMTVMDSIELPIGQHPGRYVIEQELDDGRVVLRPQTELEQMHQDLGSRPMTSDESAKLVAPYLGPPDGEG
jgi:hypothetical protein